MDIIGDAIYQYHTDENDEAIEVYIDGHFDHLLYPSVFFRNFINMNRMERTAIQLCRGKILDVGAGAGCHSLYLQTKNYDVTALDKSRNCCKVMKARGVKKVICHNILKYKSERFDTILLLMNGLGIAGELRNLKTFLNHIKQLLNHKGQILVDSTDISYTVINGEEEKASEVHYFGETRMQIQKGKDSEELKWLYLDKITLVKYCSEVGLNCTILRSDSKHRFLARINFSNQIIHP